MKKCYYGIKQIIVYTTLILATCAFMRSFKARNSSIQSKNWITANELEVRNSSLEKGNWKTILLWSEFYGKFGSWKKIFKRYAGSECEERRCHFTTTKRKLNLVSAVLFDGTELQVGQKTKKGLETFENLPKHRNLNQIYVFFNLDPPPNYGDVEFEKYENFFNWTMTYRADSDVVVPYGKIIRRSVKKPRSEINYVTEEELKGKKMAIWLESHCNVQSRRREFVGLLENFIPIEIFGKCSGRKCGFNSLIYSGGVGKDQCEKTFRNYVFFLALENSFCKDYVTEKFFRSLKLGIIPITYGAVNYSSIAPPNSFIDAKGFSSVQQLALYMKRVAGDVNLYNEYLKWQEDYDIDVGFPYSALTCDLCKQLHTPSKVGHYKWYADIEDWFVKKSSCYEFTNFFK